MVKGTGVALPVDTRIVLGGLHGNADVVAPGPRGLGRERHHSVACRIGKSESRTRLARTGDAQRHHARRPVVVDLLECPDQS